jgi:uncharacterized protein (TIRG00374 family)
VRLKAFLHSPTGAVLRYIVSFGLVALILTQVDWAALSTVHTVSWPLVGASLLCVGLGYAVQAWRWHILLRAQDFPLRAIWTQRVSWLGFFYNSFFPGGIAGDVARFSCLHSEFPDRKADGATSLVLDRILGLGSLFVLAAIGLGLHVSNRPAAEELRTLLLISVIVCSLLIAITVASLRTRWAEVILIRLFGRERGRTLSQPAQVLGRDTRTLVLTSALSFLVWLLDFAALWTLALSIGLNLGMIEISVAAAAAYIVASLPISIGGHGVREGALVAMLTLLSPIDDLAGITALTIGFWVVSVFWNVAGALALFFKPRARPTAAISVAEAQHS